MTQHRLKRVTQSGRRAVEGSPTKAKGRSGKEWHGWCARELGFRRRGVQGEGPKMNSFWP